jgi:hypothetical protein
MAMGRSCYEYQTQSPPPQFRYTFTNAGGPACVAVNLDTPQGINTIFSEAYATAYNPANVCQNYLADVGAAEASQQYSFDVAAGQVFVVVVNEVNSGVGCTNCTLHVTGFDCPQRLDLGHDPSSASRVILKMVHQRRGL